MNKPVLYISYDGMHEPLGQSQVLAYLEILVLDRPIHLLSFEKAEDWAQDSEQAALRIRIAACGIHWHPRRYHKQPSSLATTWDIGIGVLSALWLVLRFRIGIVHARSYVAGVMAWLVTQLTGTKFLFDMRGFWSDERVDGALWTRDGRMYRVAKWFERRFLLDADHVVSLTHAARREIETFEYLRGRLPPMTVIPTCADLGRFVPTKQTGNEFVLGYVGSVGTWYHFDAVLECFRHLLMLRPDARLLIINRNEHAYIQERFAVAGIPVERTEIKASDHSEVPKEMARMHAGIFFYRPSYSRVACSPTKLGEFLGCGIPCLSNQGVGDMAQILEGDGVGVALADFEVLTLQSGLARLLQMVPEPGMAERCAASAQRHFSLDEGVYRYRAIYSALDAVN